MDTKEIRFIDSNYNELFRIPDGGYVYILEKPENQLNKNEHETPS